MYERKKISSFEITVIEYLLFKKDFKSPELLTKTFFSRYFTDRSKNGEGNKGEVCVQTKHASRKVAKAEVNLN